MKHTGGFVRGFVLAVVLALAAGSACAQTAERHLMVGDSIQMEVDGRPELRQLLILDSRGRVTIAQIGEVYLAGLTLADAEATVARRMRIYDPSLETVRVNWTDATAMTLRIQGAVGSPGSYDFEEQPTVWSVIQAAGGVLESADLTVARVLREESGDARILPLDLSALVAGGRLPGFEFHNGDVIVVPTAETGTSPITPTNGVQIFGAVADPAVVPMSAPRPLLDVLMLAGSPLATAELARIWLVHPSAGRYDSRLIDLSLFMKEGDPVGNPLVYPGDMLQVEFQRDGWFRRNGPLVLGSMTAVATIWLAYDRVMQ